MSESEAVPQDLKLHDIVAPVPEVMTLYSLDATYIRFDEEAAAKLAPETEFFHEWPVLGKKSLTDASERKLLWDALNKGIQESTGAAAACFEPRHGIRVEQEAVRTDYVICFHCARIGIFSEDRVEEALTSASAQPAFNQILEKARIPVAPGGN